MIKHALLSVCVALALVVSGCASKGNKNASAGRTTGTTSSDSGFSTSGTADSDFGSGTDIASGTGTSDVSGLDVSQRTVYFELDSTEINAEGQAIVSRFAQYLVNNPSARVRLEGHADERGTREYNLGLGERRALAVQSALIAQGATASQISVVSYGEERPVSPGHDESAWSQNRRVEILQL